MDQTAETGGRPVVLSLRWDDAIYLVNVLHGQRCFYEGREREARRFQHRKQANFYSEKQAQIEAIRQIIIDAIGDYSYD